jgi:hypothetical protein
MLRIPGMAAHKLILHPANPTALPTGERNSAALLRDIGLIGDSSKLDGKYHYFTGDGFLSLVTFLGCAPTIETPPPAGAAELAEAARARGFCHISLGDTLPAPRLRADPCSRARCPVCRKMQTWSGPGTDDSTRITMSCGHCHVDSPIEECSWRQNGGVARLFVDIWGVYPSEAVPGDLLLHTLATVTESPWVWFYSMR